VPGIHRDEKSCKIAIMDWITILLLLVFAGLGIASGMLIQHARDRHQPQPPPPPEPIMTEITEREDSLPGDVETTRLGRSRSGDLWLEMDGKRVRGGEALLSEQRRRLVRLVLDLRPWLEKIPPNEGFPFAMPRSGMEVSPGEPELNKKVPTEPAKGIVEQIEDILQARLAESPLKERDIHLLTGRNGVVLIKDGTNTYEGLDSVADPEVQAFIRQAVAEWEKSHT
jgi:hypothetical protein